MTQFNKTILKDTKSLFQICNTVLILAAQTAQTVSQIESTDVSQMQAAAASNSPLALLPRIKNKLRSYRHNIFVYLPSSDLFD